MKTGRVALPRGRDGMVTPVYVDDLVDCIVLAATSDAAEPGQAYVAWPGQVVTGADFMAYYARMLGKGDLPRLPAPVHRAAVWAEERLAQVAGRPPAVTAAAMSYLNREHAYTVSRAREVLGWEPQVDSTRACAAPRPGSGRRACCPSLPPHVWHRRLCCRGRRAPRPRCARAHGGRAGSSGSRRPGVEVVGNVGLVHTRLSIVDPSPAGHQPMVDESGDWWLTYNGEVFNHLELRTS